MGAGGVSFELLLAMGQRKGTGTVRVIFSETKQSIVNNKYTLSGWSDLDSPHILKDTLKIPHSGESGTYLFKKHKM